MLPIGRTIFEAGWHVLPLANSKDSSVNIDIRDRKAILSNGTINMLAPAQTCAKHASRNLGDLSGAHREGSELCNFSSLLLQHEHLSRPFAMRLC